MIERIDDQAQYTENATRRVATRTLTDRGRGRAVHTKRNSNPEQPLSPRQEALTAPTPPPHEICFESVPHSLTKLGRWVNWNWQRGNKWTKLPKQPSGQNASTTNCQTWNDFETVVKTAQTKNWGIGFVFNGDGIVGIDIDDCRDPQTGEIQGWALEIIQLLNTYTEVSPSLTGVKLFVRGSLPEQFIKKHPRVGGLGAVEIFNKGRFFTVTGQRLPEAPEEVEERSQNLRRVFQIVTAWKPNTVTPSAVPAPTTPGAPATSDHATAKAALQVLSPDVGYDIWLKIGMALHSVDQSEDMLQEWARWSSGSNKFQPDLCEQKWKSFKTRGVRIGTLCRLADQTGKVWRPATSVQRLPTAIAVPSSQLKSVLRTSLGKLQHGVALNEVLNPISEIIASLKLPLVKPTFETLTSRELDEGQYTQEYFISNILARGEPCILAGPKKCLKTNVLIDLTLSLASGDRFLNAFDVTRPIRAALVSGESGQATIQETARRVARSKSRKNLAQYENAFWSFDLPKLGQPDTVNNIVTYIRQHKLELLILDPAYLCMPLGDSAGNMFIVGAMLADLTQIMAQTGCTIILCHHTRKTATESFAPAELDSIAWAGFSEWMRQWILLSRRAPYDPDNHGHHELWLSTGGSAGHSGNWAVDIREGRRSDPIGRRWQVTVDTSPQLKERQTRERLERKTALNRQTKELNRKKLLDAYQRFPAGETGTTIRQAAGLSGAKYNMINSELLQEGLIEACQIVKANKKYEAYRLQQQDKPDGAGPQVNIHPCPGGAMSGTQSLPNKGDCPTRAPYRSTRAQAVKN